MPNATTDLNHNISTNLINHIASTGITRSQLAKTIGHGRQYLNDRLNETKGWDIEDISQLSATLGLTAEELMAPPPQPAQPELLLADNVQELGRTHPRTFHLLATLAAMSNLQPTAPIGNKQIEEAYRRGFTATQLSDLAATGFLQTADDGYILALTNQ